MKPGASDPAGGIDHTIAGRLRQPADSGDPAVAHPDVGTKPWIAGAVDDAGVADQNVVIGGVQAHERPQTRTNRYIFYDSGTRIVLDAEERRAPSTRYSFISVRFTTASRKPCSQQKLAALKAFRQFLADRLLDDARTRETDQRAGLGDVQVAQHGEAGGDAARRRVGQHADVGNAGLIQTHQRGTDLRQLHQADSAFLHARAARGGDDDQRELCGRSARSIARVIFSPTTAPMLPPMNFSSSAQM